ncbi:hypothetical protein ACSX1A_11805 [Pontibacter sp. MBLB2868]|uniref:hypothetical protein n=1 Tax=Pontibacter sp. MBLB2868 TaxID=3451555 RepID=UPI003F75350D
MRSINGGLPLDFMLRFGIFWFLSFVLALLFFLFHLHLNKYYFSDSDILQSSRLGKMAFTVSVGAAIIGGILYTAVD